MAVRNSGNFSQNRSNTSASGYKRDMKAAQQREPNQRTERFPKQNFEQIRQTPQEKPKKHRPRRAKKFRLFSTRSGMDLTLLFLVLALVSVGLVMLFSSSYAYAYYNMNGDSYFFVRKQAFFAVLGIAVMIAISYFDYHHLHRFAIPLLIITCLVLMLMVPLKGTSLVPNRNGAFRWIELPFLGSVQPSEVAKFAVILIFAHLISINYKQMNNFRYGVLPYLAILGAVCGLVILEKHLSATLIILILGLIMLFIGGVPLKWFGIGIGGVAGVGALSFLFLRNSLLSYTMPRIQGWLNPLNPPDGVDTWQTRQSLYAIGSGGLLGLGLGKSRQKYLYLPEPQNDFIFAIVCEELGFIGATLIVLLFAALVWRGIMISLRAQDKFGMLLGIGLTMQVGLQVVLNIAVVTNLVPNTGISLPFFSYGGSSLMILLAEMGILLSISRTSNIEKT